MSHCVTLHLEAWHCPKQSQYITGTTRLDPHLLNVDADGLACVDVVWMSERNVEISLNISHQIYHLKNILTSGL